MGDYMIYNTTCKVVYQGAKLDEYSRGEERERVEKGLPSTDPPIPPY